jgi:hypothetical protein
MIEWEKGAKASFGENTPDKVSTAGIINPVIGKGNTSKIQHPAANANVARVLLVISG